MAKKAKKRKPGRKVLPLSRTDLLPLSEAQARDVSLRTHLTLVAVRAGHGNLTMLGELLKTVFIAYFVCKTDGRIPFFEDFVEAARGLEAGMDSGEAQGLWDIEDESASAIEVILALHDRQLAVEASYRIERAKEQLRVILDKGAFPDLAHAYAMENHSSATSQHVTHATAGEATQAMRPS